MSFTLLPLVFCAPLFLVDQHDSPSTEHKLRIAFLGVVMCLLSVISILSSNDTVAKDKVLPGSWRTRVGRWHSLWTREFSSRPAIASCSRQRMCLHYWTRGPTKVMSLNIPLFSLYLCSKKMYPVTLGSIRRNIKQKNQKNQNFRRELLSKNLSQYSL